MHIVIDQPELKEAIVCYLQKQGFNTDIYDVDVNIKVSRSSEDNKIEVDLKRKTEELDKPVIPAGQIARGMPANDTVPFGGLSDEVSGD